MEIISQLIQKLKQLQSKGDAYYLPGMFPSQRFHTILPYKREDENVFFSAAVALTLQEFEDKLNEEDRNIARSIYTAIIPQYQQFKNARGLDTYNNFKTNPPKYFPNGYFFSKFKQFKLADDIDDTAYIFLTKQHTQEQAVWLKHKLILHANGYKRHTAHIFKKYCQKKLYSVFFGEKMPINIDACAITNILLFIGKYQIPLNEYDTDSLNYLIAIVESDEYINTPYIVSPYYPTNYQIIYHLARLISSGYFPQLNVLEEKLIKDGIGLLQRAKCFNETLLLSIALLRLKTKVPEIKYDLESVINNNKNNFFYVSLFLLFDNYKIRSLDRYKIFQFFHFRTRSKGYISALLLEYECLKNLQ